MSGTCAVLGVNGVVRGFATSGCIGTGFRCALVAGSGPCISSGIFCCASISVAVRGIAIRDLYVRDLLLENVDGVVDARVFTASLLISASLRIVSTTGDVSGSANATRRLDGTGAGFCFGAKTVSITGDVSGSANVTRRLDGTGAGFGARIGSGSPAIGLGSSLTGFGGARVPVVFGRSMSATVATLDDGAPSGWKYMPVDSRFVV